MEICFNPWLEGSPLPCVLDNGSMKVLLKKGRYPRNMSTNQPLAPGFDKLEDFYTVNCGFLSMDFIKDKISSDFACATLCHYVMQLQSCFSSRQLHLGCPQVNFIRSCSLGRGTSVHVQVPHQLGLTPFRYENKGCPE